MLLVNLLLKPVAELFKRSETVVLVDSIHFALVIAFEDKQEGSGGRRCVQQQGPGYLRTVPALRGIARGRRPSPGRVRALVPYQ